MITLQCIWNMRNNKVFGNEQPDFHKSIMFLRRSFQSFKHGLLEIELEKLILFLDSDFIKWKKSGDNSFKFSFDGAYKYETGFIAVIATDQLHNFLSIWKKLLFCRNH